MRGRRPSAATAAAAAAIGAKPAVVELHRVLADLQDHRPAGLFGARDDRLGVFEGDDVKGHQSRAGAMGGGDQIGGSGERHRAVLPEADSGEASVLVLSRLVRLGT